MKKSNLNVIWAIVTYTIITAIFAWPLFFKFKTAIFGVQNDSLGTLWGLWWSKVAIFQFHLFPSTSPMIAAPFGVIIPYFFPFNYLISIPVVSLWGTIPAFNILSLLGFVLTGFAMYLLAMHFTKNFWASLIAGMILAFSPYHLVNAQSFLDLGQIEWLIFYLYFLFRLKEKPTAFNLIFANIFCLITLLSSHYYAVFLVFLTILFLLVYLIVDWQKIKFIKFFVPKINLVILINFLIIAAILLFAFILFNRNMSKVNLPSFDDIMNFGSVKWWYYLLPSMQHPIFGKWVQGHVIGVSFAAQTHYLGYTTLLLSIFALLFKENWKKFIFFVIAAVFAFLLSLPPKIYFGSTIVSMPSYYLFEFLPFVRFVSRFSLIIMISLSLLSAAAIKILIENKKTGIQIAIIASIFVLFLIEFLPNFTSTKLNKLPEMYQFIKNQPGDFLVVEYPFFSNSPWMWEQMYFQTEHQKKLVNNFEFKTQNEEAFNNFYGAVENITNPNAIYFLKLMGVKYIIVHLKNQEAINDGIIKRSTLRNLEQIKSNPELKLVKETPEGDVFEIENSLPTVSLSSYPLMLRSGKDMLFFKDKLKNTTKMEDAPIIFVKTNQKQDAFIDERAINNLLFINISEMDFDGQDFIKTFNAPQSNEPRDYRLILNTTEEKANGKILINGKEIKNLIKSSDLLPKDNQLIIKPAKVKNNLFKNTSFEADNLWGKVWNLTLGKEGEDKFVKAEKIKDGTDGDYALKLTSNSGTMASTRQAIENVDPNALYLISFDYKHIRGSNPRYAILEDTGTNDSKIENVKVGEWQHLQILYRPKPNTRFAALEFYSDSWGNGSSINFYDNVKVTKIDSNITDIILEPILPRINPEIEINYRKENDNRYQAIVKNAEAPYFLIFLENYDKNRKVEIDGKTVPESDHYQVAGYANGWYLTKKGDYQINIIKR